MTQDVVPTAITRYAKKCILTSPLSWFRTTVLRAGVAQSVWRRAKGCTPEELGVQFPAGTRNFFFSTSSRPALEPAQPPIQPVWKTWGRGRSWPYQDSNSDPSVVQPVASRCTDCATPATLLYGVLLTNFFLSPWLYSRLDLGRYFSFLILYTVGRAPWTGGSVRRKAATYTE
jgi:hypothetical protein